MRPACIVLVLVGCGSAAKPPVAPAPAPAPAAAPVAIANAEPVDQWRAGCDAGDAGSCAVMGMNLRDASGSDETGAWGNRDTAEASAAFARGCELGDPDSCFSFGERAPMRDRIVAYRKGCDLGDFQLCDHLVLIYFQEWAPDLDRAASTQVLGAMCDEGIASACNAAGMRIFEDTGNDYAIAEIWHEKGCALGDPDQCTAIARHHEFVQTPEDRALAAKMYARACELTAEQGNRDERYCNFARKLSR